MVPYDLRRCRVVGGVHIPSAELLHAACTMEFGHRHSSARAGLPDLPRLGRRKVHLVVRQRASQPSSCRSASPGTAVQWLSLERLARRRETRTTLAVEFGLPRLNRLAMNAGSDGCCRSSRISGPAHDKAAARLAPTCSGRAPGSAGRALISRKRTIVWRRGSSSRTGRYRQFGLSSDRPRQDEVRRRLLHLTAMHNLNRNASLCSAFASSILHFSSEAFRSLVTG